MQYFWGIARDSGESMLYLFDGDSLLELAERLTAHKKAGLLTGQQAMDCIEFAAEMVEQRQVLSDAVEWRSKRNLEGLRRK